jgi:hypothetical protein
VSQESQEEELLVMTMIRLSIGENGCSRKKTTKKPKKNPNNDLNPYRKKKKRANRKAK